MAPLRERVLARTSGDEHTLIAATDDAALGVPDPALHSPYARAVCAAWFADPALAQTFTPPVATSPTGTAVLARLRREGFDWRDHARALSAPTLVIHGEEDALPVSVAAEWEHLLPHARRQLIAGAGHIPFWEAPDTFFPRVHSFLAARPPGVVPP